MVYQKNNVYSFAEGTRRVTKCPQCKTENKTVFLMNVACRYGVDC